MMETTMEPQPARALTPGAMASVVAGVVGLVVLDHRFGHPGALASAPALEAARRGRPRVAAGAGDGPPRPPRKNGLVRRIGLMADSTHEAPSPMGRPPWMGTWRPWAMCVVLWSGSCFSQPAGVDL